MSVFPFFVGCGRSGTTLLRAIFDSHSDLAVVHESTFVPELARRRRRYERIDGFATELLVDDVWQVGSRRARSTAPAPDWLGGLRREELREALHRASPGDYAEAVRVIFATYAGHHAKARYADKTPLYVIHIPLLAALFPESRFVHIVRDGRDVALSVLEMPWGPSTLDDAALWWKESVTSGREAGARLGVERYREIRYEELIEDPEARVRELSAFVELPFQDRMLRYFERADRIVGETRFPDRHSRLFLPPTRRLRDWRSQMPPRDQQAFGVMAGGLLAELGYETGSRPRSAGERLAAYRRYLTAAATRVARRAKWASRAAVRRIGGGATA